MFRLLSTSAIALCAAAVPVLAELAPAEVWDSIVAAQRKFGYEVTEGAREEAGDTLTITDITLHVALPAEAAPATPAGAPAEPAADAPAAEAPAESAPAAEAPATEAAPDAATPDTAAPAAGGDVSVLIPKVVLQKTGDGNVRTTFEGDITGTMTLPPQEDAPTDMTMTIAMPGNEMISSGTVEAMNHAITYRTLTATIDMKDAKGVSLPITLALTDTKGAYVATTEGEAQKTSYDLTSAEAKMSFDMNAPATAEGGGGTAKMAMTMAGLGMKGVMNAPTGTFDLAKQMSEALAAGLLIDGAMTFGAYQGNMEFSGTDAEGKAQSGSATFEGEGGDVGFVLSAEKLSYRGKSGPAKAELTSGDLPFPIAYAITGGHAEFALPITKGDAPQPFSVVYAFTGLTLGDAIWGMVDPTAQLPRDPADLTVDVSGEMLVKRDLFDQEMAAKMAAASTPAEGATELSDAQMAELEALRAEAMPYEPKTITLNKIALKAVGAEADLSGTLTVPEGGSMDAPVGKISGNFKGVTALIDRLAKLGFVPQDQVAGIKMMLAAFARPVEGQPDALTTELEFRADGTVFANGQQVK